MVRRTAWMAMCKFAESKTAKVLRDLAGPLKTLSFACCGFTLAAGCLWTIGCFVLPGICDALSFLWGHPVWLIPAVPAGMIVVFIVAVVISAIMGDGCATVYRGCDGISDFRYRQVFPCNGSIVSSFRDRLDCVRLDPLDGCFRSEPCVGLWLGGAGFVNALAKIPPCVDVLDDRGAILDHYRDLRCIELDPCEPCYRPAQC